MFIRVHSWFHLPLIAVALVLIACEPTERPDTSDQSQSTRARSPWHKQGESSVVGISDLTIERELAAATQQARDTAEQTRQRWANATQQVGARAPGCFIKWAAPTANQTVEHVWVQPINWSPFRIEGTLVSTPVHELMSPKSQGDFVSFPIEELSDWIYFPQSPSAARANGASPPPQTQTFDPTKPHEGGFTIKVLEKRFGKP